MSWEEYTSRGNDDGKSEFSMVMITSLIMMMTSIIMMMTSLIMMMKSLIMMMTSKAGTGHWRGERYIMDHCNALEQPQNATIGNCGCSPLPLNQEYLSFKLLH